MEIRNKSMTEEELVAAVRAALNQPNGEESEGFLTTRELAGQLKITTDRTQAVLRKLWEQGQLESKRVSRPSYNGPHSVMGHRLAKKAGENDAPQ